ncbi:hypothetical protein [Rubrolithibacter danxiaensis]|uniref:hypothetical protein n=1 Tax=Rubrolithibacter danxiaensis TaxID=3390805 RepID=UPI003BF820D7
MKKIILLILFISAATICRAQRLTFNQLEQLLNDNLNEAEERLFLQGYSFAEKKPIAEDATVYTFSNRKKTLTTAKVVSKAVSNGGIGKSYVQYVTYEPAEFQKLRKLMVEDGFNRSSKDSISENSNYYKDNLAVNFQTDHSNKNRAFIITLRNRYAASGNKVLKKLNLKKLFKSESNE